MRRNLPDGLWRLFFFLQAEDGMRYVAVTGVQTCALPILITSGSVVIQQATQRGMTTDPDVIILTPNATMTAVYYNSDGWSGGSRCATQGNVLFNADRESGGEGKRGDLGGGRII